MDAEQSPVQYSTCASDREEPLPSPATSRTRSRRGRPQPRRYGFACANCRARKVKCTGEQPVCRACQRSGARCTWQSSTEKMLRDANSRIRQLEEAVSEGRAATPAVLRPDDVDEASPRSGPGTACSSSEAHVALSATSPASGTSAWFQVGLGHNGAVTYNGPTSRFHAGALEHHLADEDGSQAPRQDTGASDKRAYHVDALRSQYDLLDTVWTPLIGSKSSLDGFGLDASVCLALLDIYWNWLQPLHNCVYRPCFMMDMAINGPCYSEFLLVSIFALSARHLSEQEGRAFDGIGKGECFISRARELLVEEMGSPKPKIPTIQGLLILGGRQCAMGKSSEGWLYTGMAIRMILDLGLHLHLGNSYLADLEKLTPTEVEVRKRLYNSAYIWDKTMSLALGRPPSLLWAPHAPNDILDHCDDSQEWKPVHAPEIGQCYRPAPSYNTMTFCAHSQLHKITTDMMLLYSNVSIRKNLTAEISSLDDRFAAWYADLPAQLRMDDLSSLAQSPPPHIVSLNLLYHALYILLYRPNLNSPDASVRSSSSKICISHSKDIHSAFSLYETTFPNRLMTYQVSYCVFTAASVDVYAMKTSYTDGVREAVARLGAAMRALQNEARHTPGIARTLGTIRRQLATWKPGTKMFQREHGNTSIDGGVPESSFTLHLGQSGSSTEEDNNGTRRVSTATIARTTSEGQILGDVPQESFDYFLENCPPSLSGPSFGGIDTGAGFHPDAFPWSLMDSIDKDGGDTPWGQAPATSSTF